MNTNKKRIITYALLSLVISIILCVLLYLYGDEIKFNNFHPLKNEETRAYIIGIILLITAILEIYLIYRYIKIRNILLENSKNRDANIFSRLDQLNDCVTQSIVEKLKLGFWSKKFSLYTQPWFLVIGGKASGKTELIHSFNLDEEIEVKNDSSNPINSWNISSKAIFIDIKKEPWSNVDLQKLWMHFSDWLLIKRPKRAINGIILTISIAKLIRLSSKQRLIYSLSIRKEISDLNLKLGTNIPVYLVLTKIDELEGFSGFIEKLSNERIDNPLGFSLPLASIMNWENSYHEEYENLKDEFNTLLYYGQEDASIDSNSEYYTFARQIIGLRELLYDFIKSLHNEKCNPCNTMIRGVFFTSVKQKESVFNAIAERADTLYEIEEDTESKPVSHISNVSFFSENLFKKVLMPEAGLAKDSVSYQSKVRRKAIFTYLITGLIIASLTSGWLYFYRKNTQANEQVLIAVKQYKKSSSLYPSAKPSHRYLNTLNLLKDSLDYYHTDKTFISNIKNMGLYRGEDIAQHVDETYQALLSKGFAKALVQELVTELEKRLGQPNQHPLSENKEVIEHLNLLRVIRLVSEPLLKKPEQERRHLIKYRESIARPWIATYWSKHYKNDTGEAQVDDQLLRHLDYLLKNSEAILDNSLNKRIRELQDTFTSISFSHILYQSLKRDAKRKSSSALNFTHELGGDFYETFVTKNDLNEPNSSLIIPYIFTKNGFLQYYLNNQDKALREINLDYWAIGISKNLKSLDGSSNKQLKQEIIDLYTNDYIDIWEDNINSLEMIYLSDMSSVIQFLKAASSNNSPYLNLIKTVRRNTIFTKSHSTPKENKKEGKEKEANERTDITKEVSLKLQHRFNTINELGDVDVKDKAYIDTVQKRLDNLHKYMLSVQKHSLNQSIGNLNKFKDQQAKKPDDDPIDALRRASEGLPDPLQSHFQQLADRCSQLVTTLTLQDVDKVWNDEVYRYYLKNIRGKYPFVKSKSEVSISHFKEFFAPNGILDRFYNTYIKNSSPLSESNTSANIDYELSPAQKFFEHASYIRKGLFSDNGSLDISFTIEPISLSNRYLNNVLSLSGENIKYNHGKPVEKNITWSNEKTKNITVTLTPVDRDIANEVYTVNGEWALFRFLDKTSTYKLDDQVRHIRFKGKSGVADYKLTVPKPISPFTKDLFSGFSLPKNISLPIVKENTNQEYF